MPEEEERPDPEMERVTDAIRKSGAKDTITCAQALCIAGDLSVDPILVGNALNKMRIKIRACQLGCFK